MDKSVAMSLKIVGFLLILTSAWAPIYTITFDSTTTEPEPIILVGSQSITGVLHNVYYENNLAFVVDSDTGLNIVNVTDATTPEIIGTYNIANGANGIFVKDNYAYIADTVTGLQIVNITDPTSPTQVGTYSITGGATDVFVSGNYTYIVDSTIGFQILNISDPTTPTQEGVFSISGEINGLIVKDEFAYIVDSVTGLRILNITDATLPSLVATFDVNEPAYDVAVLGSYAYIVGENIGIQVVNISNPQSPVLTSSYQIEGNVNGIHIENEHAYIVDSTIGIQIVSIINPEELTIVGSQEIIGEIYGIFVKDGYAYVVGSDLEIFRVRPRSQYDSSGTLVRIFGFKIDYKMLTYSSANNLAQERFLEAEIPSSVVILAAALWFILIFAVVAVVLGQVFQSGGFKSRGTFADIAAGILLLMALVIAILSMSRTMAIAAERYQALVTGQTATSTAPITFNPNDSTPSYFDIGLTGLVGPGFYIFTIGILMMVTGIFLPVNWQQTTSSKMSRRIGDTGVLRWVKNIASLRLTTYVTRRLLTLIPLFIAICVMTFVMVNGMGDPVALLLLGKQRVTEQDRINLTKKLGLDQPVYVQFVSWFYNLIRGDMGISFQSGQSINNLIGGLIWETLKLQLASFALALIISIPLGVLAAKNQNTWIDSAASSFALLGLSMPIFVFGLLLIYIFSGYGLGWFPAAKAHRIPAPTPVFSQTNWQLFWSGQWGGIGGFWNNVGVRLGDSLLHMALPTITLTFAFLALYTRLVRSTMLEVLRQDYVLSARANGLSERTITWKHAFRNVLIPVVTYIGLFMATALAGAPITETLFTWPGLGFKYVGAVLLLDFPMVLGTTAVLTLLILLGNLITDVAYVAVDPRIEL